MILILYRFLLNAATYPSLAEFGWYTCVLVCFFLLTRCFQKVFLISSLDLKFADLS